MYSSFSKSFKIALGFCLILAFLLMLASYLHTREAVFLWLNTDMGVIGDNLFNFCSHLAEGWIWIPYFIFLFGWFKKDAVFILLNFFISTLLTQIPKNFIWSKLSRPMASSIPHDQIHTVPGVEMNLWSSFPSGHTATAFTLFLLTIYLFDQKKLILIGLIYAMLCGYSRIYLGQHFLTDVLAGALLGSLTAVVAVLIAEKKKAV